MVTRFRPLFRCFVGQHISWTRGNQKQVAIEHVDSWRTSREQVKCIPSVHGVIVDERVLNEFHSVSALELPQFFSSIYKYA